MTRDIEAIYEKGVLRPLMPLEGIKENTRMRVRIEDDAGTPSWMRCVGIMSKEDADEMRRIINEEFGRVNLDEWK